MADWREFGVAGDDYLVLFNVEHVVRVCAGPALERYTTGRLRDQHSLAFAAAVLVMDDGSEVELFEAFGEVKARLLHGDDSPEAERQRERMGEAWDRFCDEAAAGA